MNLTDRFIELLHVTWDEFVRVEHDDNATSEEALVCGLIRACADGDMRSIKTAFARSDGEVEIPIQFKLPKFYTRYLNAKDMEKPSKKIEASEKKEEESSEHDLATAKLRETLDKMRQAPKKVVEVVLGMRTTVDESFKKGTPLPPQDSVPLVKSVIVANLLHLAGYGNSSAVTEVFNQIDGRLVKIITPLDVSDVYVDDHVTKIAPSHAFKDENGYYIAENKAMTSIWVQGLAKITPGLVWEEALSD